jgi:hypothetical protein
MSTLIIRDLTSDETLEQQAMSALRGGMSFMSRAIPTGPVRIFTPSDPIRIFTPTDPVRALDTNTG